MVAEVYFYKLHFLKKSFLNKLKLVLLFYNFLQKENNVSKTLLSKFYTDCESELSDLKGTEIVMIVVIFKRPHYFLEKRVGFD